MELKVYKDTVTAAQSICDTKLELPVETEILIPDYLPQVFKIVKCFVLPVVLQKQVLTGRLTIEGYLRCVVYYQAEEEGSLCQTEQKLPFTKQVELQPGAAQGEASVQVSGEVEYINCRALSGRRVDVRGAFVLHVDAVAQQDSEVITALSGAGVQQKTITLSGTKTVGMGEKLVTAEEPVNFEQEPQAILSTPCTAEVEDVKLVGGKAVVKGAIHVDVVYRSAAGYHLQHQAVSVPFNEIVEVDGAAEDCRGFAIVEPTGCTIAQAEEEGAAPQIALSVTALVWVKVWRPVQTVAVCDAFSTAEEMELSSGAVVLEEAGEPFRQRVEASATGQMPDAHARVLDALATALPLELIEDAGGSILRGRVVAHVLCENEMGEVDCYDKTCEYTLPMRWDVPPSELTAQCTAAVEQVKAKQTGDDVTASMTMLVSGLVSQKHAGTVLASAACTGERTKADSDIALRIYFAQPGEALFDIAKRYAASPDAIAAANELEGETLDEARQLLIPQAE